MSKHVSNLIIPLLNTKITNEPKRKEKKKRVNYVSATVLLQNNLLN
jgi:hypothetical protein